MKKLLLIDGNSILNRAYYGVRPLTAADGTPTNAIYGFLNIYFKHMEEEQPDYVCVAFDVKAPTFRHKMFDAYKAQRKPAPEDFLIQLPLIKEILTAMNCACIEKAGYEADDLIGTIAKKCEKEDILCNILTGDKDDLQLASETTKIKLVITRMGNTTTTTYGPDEVMEKYGVTPHAFIDVKGLMGDPSDNIPGVKGIGEKTALSLIQKFGSIPGVYENIDSDEITKSVRSKLLDGRKMADLSKILATIDCDVPCEISFKDFAVQNYNNTTLAALFQRFNFKTFMKKLDLEPAPADEVIRPEIRCVEATEEAAISRLAAAKEMAYTMVWDTDYPTIYCCDGKEEVFSIKSNEALLKKFFSSSTYSWIGADCKDDILRLMRLGISAPQIHFDIYLAAYLLDPARNGYDLEFLCPAYLHIPYQDAKDTDETGQMMMNILTSETEKEKQRAEKTWMIFKLKQALSRKLDETQMMPLFTEIEMPLILVLAKMQAKGIYVDKPALFAFGEFLSQKITEMTDAIYTLADETFNINSPKQLGTILFEKLQLPMGKKTKSGYSTNVDVLQKLIDKHPIIPYILEYRQLTKLRSTYVDGFVDYIQKDGRIHSNFNQTVTATGRISSTEPNLQNIPVRTELGRELRKMFIAEGEDMYFVDADYSQIELRVLAHIADDENMQKAFLNEIDIHTQTASQVFGVPLEDVTSLMRTRAKAVNFGIIYGIGSFSLSQNLKITKKEADEYIKGYLHNYPKVEKYMANTIENAKKDGYVCTALGRRRPMPELQAANKITQAFGERVAMNAPIQGTAADIIKIAMVRVEERLRKENLRAQLILQIHDELIVESPKEELVQVQQILKEEMESAYDLRVPLVVDMKIGKSWYETK